MLKFNILFMKNVNELPVEREQKDKWQYNTFAVDWPVAGEFPVFAEDMVKATLAALEKWGKVDVIRISTSGESIEGEAVVPPRILSLGEAVKWFVDNDYFSFDRKNFAFIPTKKWEGKFFRTEEAE